MWLLTTQGLDDVKIIIDEYYEKNMVYHVGRVKNLLYIDKNYPLIIGCII